MKQEKMADSSSSSTAKGNFKPAPKKNGAYVDKSRGKGLGQGKQKVIGTEDMGDPLEE